MECIETPLQLQARHTSKSGNSQLDRVQALYDAGRYLDAHREAEALGPLRQWRGLHARLLAGRLLAQLGARRLGRAVHYRAFREHPSEPEALFYYLSSCVAPRGPTFVCEVLARHAALEREPREASKAQAHVFALHASALASLRDFDRAHDRIERALAHAPDDAWVWVERASVLMLQDRLADAKHAAQHACAIDGAPPQAFHQLAMVLAENDELDQAIELLDMARSRAQSASLELTRGYLLSERGDHAAASDAWVAALALLPLADPGLLGQIRGSQALSAYLLGDHTAARTHAEQASGAFARHMLARLDTAGSGMRRKLGLGFVRQHHMTCAPATLSAIAQYWGTPVDHAELAREICYGGTSNHGERAWAEHQGFYVREFRADMAAARALIDEGIPFTLTTVEPTSGHLQAVYGYDALLQTLLVRDPSRRHFVEYPCEFLTARYGSSGPRGMAFVPQAHAARLRALQLPDSDLYDHHHRLQCALERHDRDAATSELAALSPHAEHRITIGAEAALAAYDGDRPHLLECYERLLQQFPDDLRLSYVKACLQRELTGVPAALPLLREVAQNAERTHPAFWTQLADCLRPDARTRAEARMWLRDAIAATPLDPTPQHVLADVAWEQRDYAGSVALYRGAACLSETDEHMASAYFQAARQHGQAAEALRFLEARVQRFAERSSAPLQSYFAACVDLSREEQGFAALEDGLRKRPDDAELMLFAAETLARYGRFERVDALLAAADKQAHRTDWLAACIAISHYRPGTVEPLPWLQEWASLRPLDMAAQHQLALRMRERDGLHAALAHLDQLTTRFPHHVGVARLLAQWRQELPGEAAEAALRHLAAVAPHDPWAQRELGFYLVEHGTVASARTQLQCVEALHAEDPPTLGLRGQLHLREGQQEEARSAFRRALALDVDYGAAVHGLLEACRDLNERLDALRFVKEQLIAQVNHGEGLGPFAVRARAVLPAGELLQALRDAQATRPELPAAWIALIRELLAQDRAREAQTLAGEAVQRFPLHAPLFLELAAAHRACGDVAQQRAALTQATAIAPANGEAARQLASLLLELEEFDTVEPLLARLVAREPLDCRNHGYLSLQHRRRGRIGEAIAAVSHALKLDPGYDYGWGALHELCAQSAEHAAFPLQVARELVAARPGDPRAYLVLARLSAMRGDIEGWIEAARRASELGPRLADAFDLLAEGLAERGDWDAARAACSPPHWQGPLPDSLRGRRAWLDARAGRLPAAIAAMTALVREHPNYEWGLRQLADWCEAHGDAAGALQASEGLLRIDAQSAFAHGYMGSALIAIGDHARARTHLLRSLELDPHYVYAALRLFDSSLHDNNLELAARTLSRLREQAPDHDVVLLRALHYALARGEQTQALDTFRTLIGRPEQSQGSHAEALQMMTAAGLQREADRLLEAVLEDPAAEPGAAIVWPARVQQRQFALVRALLAAARGTLGRAGVSLVASVIMQAGVRGWFAGWWLRIARVSTTLHRHTPLWAAMGYALAHHSKSACARWMADWQSRSDLAGWMLNNLGVALEDTGRFDRAAEVREAALRLPPDNSFELNHVSHAWHLALRGATDQAHAALQTAPSMANTLFAELTTLLIALQRASTRSATTTTDRLIALCDRRAIRRDRQPADWSICAHTLRAILKTEPWYRRLWLRTRFEGRTTKV